jgi:hypothetical protein
MNRRCRAFLVAIAAALSLGLARAQAITPSKIGTTPTAPIATSVMRAAHGIASVDGELWAVGPDYKACFHAGGVEFHPVLGGDAPRNFPFAFELEAIHRGDAALIERTSAVSPQLGADGVVHFARGLGIDERYEACVDGLEQSFVFRERPHGSGDLVVRGRVASELRALAGEHEALEFTLPAWGGVSVGAVTGVDARGRTTAGRLRWDGTALELVLPGDFVDAATYPLVLDPKIGTVFLVASTNLDEGEPDVAFDATYQRYLVVWHRKVSATDYDIVGQLVNAAGILTGNVIPLEVSSAVSATFPTVANVRTSSRFLVAWSQYATTNQDIYARAVALPLGGVSNLLPVLATAANEFTPVACGERTTVDDEAYIVCKRDGLGIVGIRVLVPTGADPLVIAANTLVADDNAYRPAISKSFGDGGRALIVYNYLFAAGDTDLYALLVNRDGAVLVPTTPFATTLDSESEPAVDGDGTNFMVAFSHKPNPSGDAEIEVRRVTYNAPTLSFGPFVPLTNDALNQSLPAIAWTPGKAFVAWTHPYPLDPLDVDVYAVGVGSSDCKICEGQFTLDLSGTWDTTPSLASQYSGGGLGDQVFATWYSGEILTFLEKTNVKAQLLEAFGPGGAVVDLGGGCGGGGVANVLNGLTAGNPNFAIEVSGAESQATIGFLFVAAGAVPLVCGSCSVILSGAQFPVPLFNGGATKALPIPCDANILGVDVVAQWVVFPTSASPCSLFGSASASNRLRLTVGQ